jgi:uncharacterized protein (DUF362 family)
VLALRACGVKERTLKTRENIGFCRGRLLRTKLCAVSSERLPMLIRLFAFLICLLGFGLRAEPVTPTKEARVVVVENPRATSAFEPDPNVVRCMVERGIVRFTGQTNSASAWRSLVSTNDIIGIKVFSTPGPHSGTRPTVVAAVVEELLAAGMRATNIVIWDKHLWDLRFAGFDDVAQKYHVRLAGAAEAGFDPNVYYDNAVIGNLVWGDLEFRKGAETGRKSYVSKLLTHDITKIINIPPLLNHNMAGVSGALYSLAMGSVDNSIRFESRPDRLATAVPDIYNLTNLFDRVAINITDALIGQYRGGEETLLHYATEVNQIWLSKDAVALDVLAVTELEREREAAKATLDKPSMELYQNASLLEIGISDPKRIHVEMFKEYVKQ